MSKQVQCPLCGGTGFILRYPLSGISRKGFCNDTYCLDRCAKRFHNYHNDCPLCQNQKTVHEQTRIAFFLFYPNYPPQVMGIHDSVIVNIEELPHWDAINELLEMENEAHKAG